MPTMQFCYGVEVSSILRDTVLKVAHYDEVRITNSSENIDDRPKEI